MKKRKRNSLASGLVGELIQRAYETLEVKTRERVEACKTEALDDLKKKNSKLVAKQEALLKQIEALNKTLSNKGFAPTYSHYYNLNVPRECQEAAVREVQKQADAKRKQLEALELEMALLAVSGDTNLLKETKALVAKIQAIVGD